MGQVGRSEGRQPKRSAAPSRLPQTAGVTSGKIAFVLGGGGQLGAHEVGMLQALVEARRGARPRGRHLHRRHQRRRRGRRPDRARGSSGWPDVDADRAPATPSTARCFGRLATLARTRTHLHGIGPLKRLLEEQLDGGADRGPAGAVPVRGRLHRDRLRAVVHRGPAGRRRAGVLRRCPGSCRPTHRRRALPRRRRGEQHPGRPGGRSWAPTGSTSCTWAASSAGSSRRAGPGRSGWWPSRSRAGTASSATWPRCPTTSRCT